MLEVNYNETPEICGVFEKVSYERYKEDFKEIYGDSIQESVIRKIYDNIKLPKRSTTGSAGYDFFAPFGFNLQRGNNILIPTGIRCKIKNNYWLCLAPRSGMGFKYRIMMANTFGIIDSDYYNSDNEGHMKMKLVYDGIDNPVTIYEANEDDDKVNFKMTKKTKHYTVIKPMVVEAGDKIFQGIFIPYGITEDDDATGIRNGGFNSTGN